MRKLYYGLLKGVKYVGVSYIFEPGRWNSRLLRNVCVFQMCGFIYQKMVDVIRIGCIALIRPKNAEF